MRKSIALALIVCIGICLASRQEPRQTAPAPSLGAGPAPGSGPAPAQVEPKKPEAEVTLPKKEEPTKPAKEEKVENKPIVIEEELSPLTSVFVTEKKPKAKAESKEVKEVQPKCGNPLFSQAEFSRGGFDRPAYLNEPQVGKDLVACLQFEGKSSCCDKRTTEQIKSGFEKWKRENEEKLSKSIHEVKEKFLGFIKMDLSSLKDQAGRTLTAIQREMVSIQKRIFAVNKEQAKCAESLFNYTTGMLCYGCNPMWEKFQKKGRLTLATASIKKIGDSCWEYFRQVEEFSADAKLTQQRINDELVYAQMERAKQAAREASQIKKQQQHRPQHQQHRPHFHIPHIDIPFPTGSGGHSHQHQPSNPIIRHTNPSNPSIHHTPTQQHTPAPEPVKRNHEKIEGPRRIIPKVEKTSTSTPKPTRQPWEVPKPRPTTPVSGRGKSSGSASGRSSSSGSSRVRTTVRKIGGRRRRSLQETSRFEVEAKAFKFDIQKYSSLVQRYTPKEKVSLFDQKKFEENRCAFLLAFDDVYTACVQCNKVEDCPGNEFMKEAALRVKSSWRPVKLTMKLAGNSVVRNVAFSLRKELEILRRAINSRSVPNLGAELRNVEAIVHKGVLSQKKSTHELNARINYRSAYARLKSILITIMKNQNNDLRRNGGRLVCRDPTCEVNLEKDGIKTSLTLQSWNGVTHEGAPVSATMECKLGGECTICFNSVCFNKTYVQRIVKKELQPTERMYDAGNMPELMKAQTFSFKYKKAVEKPLIVPFLASLPFYLHKTPCTTREGCESWIAENIIRGLLPDMDQLITLGAKKEEGSNVIRRVLQVVQTKNNIRVNDDGEEGFDPFADQEKTNMKTEVKIDGVDQKTDGDKEAAALVEKEAKSKKGSLMLYASSIVISILVLLVLS